nr:transposase [Hylemonella gracilis]
MEITEEQIAYALRLAESGMPVVDVCRQIGVSEATFYTWKKKYLRWDEIEPTYTRRVSPSKLGPNTEKLTTWLGIEATKLREPRRNLKQIYIMSWPVAWGERMERCLARNQFIDA